MGQEMNLVQLVGNLGFPIAVATYCLVVLNTSIKNMTDTMGKLCVCIETIKSEKAA